ncbi:iron chaperone [Parasediminibacterium paludis]|uniref:Iron chaperone n=1 Tax=Parasediminibacterium paludis TaxID=908966 RepID=A0ABV8Q0X1_9BACT
MQTDKPKPTDIDSYIADFPEATQALLQQIRATIQAAAPNAIEIISYAIPTFVYHGNLVHFAGYKQHIGFYPGAAGIAAFRDEISQYKWAKGSVQFPLNEPLPLDLVTRIVHYKLAQNVAKVAKKKKQ